MRRQLAFLIVFESYLWDFFFSLQCFIMPIVKEIVEQFEALSSPPQHPRAVLNPPLVPASVPSEDYRSVRDQSSVVPSDESFDSSPGSVADSFADRHGPPR